MSTKKELAGKLDEAKSLGRMFRSMAAVLEVLEDVKSLDQMRQEAKAATEAAVSHKVHAEAEAADAEKLLGKFRKEISEAGQLQAKRMESVQKQAAEIVKVAQRKAVNIAEEVNKMAADVQLVLAKEKKAAAQDIKNLEVQRKTLETAVKELKNELAAIRSRLIDA